MVSMLVLYAVVAVIAVFLFVPFRVRASGAFGERECWGRAELCWGFGFATVKFGSEADGRVYVFGVPLLRVKSFPKVSRKKKHKERKALKRTRLLFGKRGLLLRMVARGLRAFHPRLHVAGTLGLGDPADTAVMLTAVHQIDHLVADWIELEIRDDFLEDTTQLFGRVHAWIIPIEIVLIVLLWVIRPDTRRVLRGN